MNLVSYLERLRGLDLHPSRTYRMSPALRGRQFGSQAVTLHMSTFPSLYVNY
jgi:hypothetical protein